MDSPPQSLSRALARGRRSLEKRLNKLRAAFSAVQEQAETAKQTPKELPAVAVPTTALPERSTLAPPAKVLAWYLPQFHPVPENNAWWGNGFTEWKNVVRATPVYKGHYQPQLPADLGFYDLRVPETQEDQVSLARKYGIHGFAYHYYWFNGRRLLERPLEQMLRTGKPDFPFCINWANENWTRRWDGLDQEILLGQEHSLESDVRFLQDVLPILKDPRYITCEGKPLLIVYRPDFLRNAAETAAAWREEAKSAGLPGLHLCAVQFMVRDPRPLGFDALIEFPPHQFRAPKLDPADMGAAKDFRGTIYHFGQGALRAAGPDLREFPFYRGVMPGWDNTARRSKNGTIFHGATPEIYQYWLHQILVEARHTATTNDHFVFINAWNEWAEGAHLEPDQTNGHQWLEATRKASEAAARDGRSRPEPPDVPTFSGTTGLTISPGKAVAASAVLIPWKTPDSWGARPRQNRRPVLCVSHDAARAGAQLVLLRFVQKLASHEQLEPWVLLRHGGALENEFRQAAPVLRVDEVGNGKLSFQNALEWIVRDFKKRDPLLALCNTVVSSDVAAICDAHGIPVLSHVHELPTSIESIGRDSIERTRRHSRKIVVVSDYVRDALSRAYQLPDSQIVVLRNGITDPSETYGERTENRAAILHDFDWPPDAFVVIGCGSIHPRKGPDLFVQLALTSARLPGGESLRFLWVGHDQDGPLLRRWCEHDLAAAGLNGRMRFAGEQTNTARFFAASNALALTSREDPFPTINLEALAAGIPVVAFEGAGGAAEALTGDAGITVPYLDVQTMASVLVRLANSSSEASAIGRRAREQFCANFTYDQYYGRFLDLIEREFGALR